MMGHDGPVGSVRLKSSGMGDAKSRMGLPSRYLVHTWPPMYMALNGHFRCG